MDNNWYTIAPLGTGDSLSGSFGWNSWGIPSPFCSNLGVDDFAFVQAILDFMEESLCVNEK